MFASFWATLYLWLNPLWRLNVDGKEAITLLNTLIVGTAYEIEMGNHGEDIPDPPNTIVDEIRISNVIRY